MQASAKMLYSYIVLVLSFVVANTVADTFPVHNITRHNLFFENLAVRANGQILTTTTQPNASVYQVDPLGILPLTLIHTVPNVTSANGIVEGDPGVFYFASGDVNLTAPLDTHPQSYTITQIDVRGTFVLPNGTLSQPPKTKTVASLPGAALLNGIAFAGPGSDYLLVADSFRGLIWNVNVQTGAVDVTLNSTETQGPGTSGLSITGVNGIKVLNGTMYWTNTGRSTLYKVAIDEQGRLCPGAMPTLIASDLGCDDLLVDECGYAYVAAPLDVITKVSPSGEKEVIAGTFNSTASALGGPTALRFGRLVSDRWSLYVTTNGGLATYVPGTAGVSRIDLGNSVCPKRLRV